MAERIRVMVPDIQGGAEEWKTYLAGTTAADIFYANPHVLRELRQLDGTDCYVGSQAPPPGKYKLVIRQAGGSAPRLDSTLDGSIQFLKTLTPALPSPPALAAAHDSIHNALWDDPAWQLPVLDVAYPGLAQRLGPNFVQKYSENCHAPFDFAVHVTNRLAKPMSAGNTDEICVAGWVDKFLWDTFEMVAQANRPACFKRKRNQANPSASAFGSGRPDFSILVWNNGLLAMLFVGEGKALESDIAAAYSDLIRKAPEVWGSGAYSDKIEFLVAYAAAGSRMRIGLLPRMRALIGGLDVVLPEGLDLQSTPLIPIGRELNLASPEDTARLMLAVPAIYQIVSAQMPHLRAGHGSLLEKDDGTMLYFRPPIVTKYVPLTAHPHLQGELPLLQSVYERLTCSGAQHVVTLAKTVKGDSPSSPTIKVGGWYRVATQPVGVQLSGVPSTISTAIRFFTHILLGLKELAPGSPTRRHPDVCHGDLRPENVILCGDRYCLCDLEGAIKVGDRYDKARHGPNRQAWGPHQEAWVDGKFVIQSDLWAVGKMVATACAQIPGFGAAGGIQLAQQLSNFQFASHDDVLKVLSKISL